MQLILLPLPRLGLLRVCLRLPPRRSLGLPSELTKGLLPELRSQDKVVPSTEAGGRLFVSCRVNTAPLYRILLSHVSVLLPRVLLDHMYATCHSTVVASLVMSARNFFLRWTLYLLPQGHILWLFKKRTGVKTVLLNIPPVPGR